ncbi:MAG: LptF/LptG family permease [Treponema sp.]|nr:LptF/LptG family permease [Treponema sp.]
MVRRFASAHFSLNRRYSPKTLGTHVIASYVVKELLLYFFVAFLFFFAIFFVNHFLLLAESILRQRVPVWDVIRLIVYALPFVIAQSAPFATLVGFLSCLGRLVSDNEVLIMRAAGIGFRPLVRIVLVLGVGISAASFFVNDVLLPVGTIRYYELYRAILQANPTVALEPNSVRQLRDATIVVGAVTDGRISDVVFFDATDTGTFRVIVAGESTARSKRSDGVLLQLDMAGGTALLIDPRRRQDVDVLHAANMGLTLFDTAVFGTHTVTRPQEMTSYDLGRELRRMRHNPDADRRQVNDYSLEFNKKFSLPFASLFFAFLALPLAFLFGKQNGLFIGIVTGLFICFLYWAMIIVGQLFASRNGFSGFWSMWIPNLIIGGAGVFFNILLRRQ